MNNFDPTAIENAFIDAIYNGGVSQNVFPNRPRSSERDLSDFVVCHINGTIRDRGALGECTFFVALFAKNVNNMKNGAKLSVMQTRLKALPVEFDNIVLQPYTFTPNGDIPSDAGYHTRVFYINAFIKIA